MMSSADMVLTIGELATSARIPEAVSDIRDAAVAKFTTTIRAVTHSTPPRTAPDRGVASERRPERVGHGADPVAGRRRPVAGAGREQAAGEPLLAVQVTGDARREAHVAVVGVAQPQLGVAVGDVQVGEREAVHAAGDRERVP